VAFWGLSGPAVGFEDSPNEARRTGRRLL